MKKVEIQIYQGKEHQSSYADINIIIDVIRAFSVSYYAFKNEVKEIILVSSEKEACELKEKNELFVTSGEINGYKIASFDFGNSPYEITKNQLKEKTLVQKTTNGVAVTLSSLNAEQVFVTGYVNALSLARHIKKIIKESNKDNFKINIIASHPTGDEDLVCAEYIKKIILEDKFSLKELDSTTLYRIANCKAAQKFWDVDNRDFDINDIIMVLNIENNDFVMEVIKEEGSIKIKKKVV